MKSRLQNGNYFLNKDFAYYHRPQIPVTIQSKSAIEIKPIPQPTNYQKKQKTIHYYDQYKFEQYTSAKTKLYDLLSLRQTNRTPIQRRRQAESSLIVKRNPEIFTSVVEMNDVKQKVKTVSQECPRTQQKITMVQHSAQLASTQKRNHNHSKSTNNNNTSTPILNKTVSQFQCFTPLTNSKNNAQSDLMQRIKQQKLESLINLIINNQLNNIVHGFTLIKNTAPLLPYIKDLERRKAEFKQKRFQFKLIRIK
ncbi:unnamed protein product (macronuclear) [Paramecium tetraurelia]|uniref:Enkurin domain-containing protein n=1 Tax=Paramecium tetraurelia TaxID=5888 RepID=A0BVX8_PARTE|nr:uncharacterized protein GSPATT00032547001 [Paramecium tetraurelia]CAK62695.1 unnamed protein product [Paramecium tetraurelia]|eukprot:XP_001430093.1 hypothetical protein (macronuclear) [Paramecium tetraurelia strain d4-2]